MMQPGDLFIFTIPAEERPKYKALFRNTLCHIVDLIWDTKSVDQGQIITFIAKIDACIESKLKVAMDCQDLAKPIFMLYQAKISKTEALNSILPELLASFERSEKGIKPDQWTP